MLARREVVRVIDEQPTRVGEADELREGACASDDATQIDDLGGHGQHMEAIVVDASVLQGQLVAGM